MQQETIHTEMLLALHLQTSDFFRGGSMSAKHPRFDVVCNVTEPIVISKSFPSSHVWSLPNFPLTVCVFKG